TVVNCKVIPSTITLDSVRFTAPGKRETKKNISGSFSFTFDQNDIPKGNSYIKITASLNNISFSDTCTITRIAKVTPRASEITIIRFFCEGMGAVPFNHYLKEYYDEINYSVSIIPGSKTLYLVNSKMESVDNIDPSSQPIVFTWTEYHYYKNPKEFGKKVMDISYIDENNRVGKSRSGIWVKRGSNLNGISKTICVVLSDGYTVYPSGPIINACVDRSIP
ncbi:MAG: hypothetical protein DRP84_10580, partial [Spirochaetes bacterium]